MKKFVYFLMVGLAFTAFQVSVVEAQGNKKQNLGNPSNVKNPNQQVSDVVTSVGGARGIKVPKAVTSSGPGNLSPGVGVSAGGSQGLSNVDLQNVDGGASTQGAGAWRGSEPSSIDFGHMPTTQRPD